MFGYVTFNVKNYILSQIFYKKNRVMVCLLTLVAQKFAKIIDIPIAIIICIVIESRSICFFS